MTRKKGGPSGRGLPAQWRKPDCLFVPFRSAFVRVRVRVWFEPPFGIRLVESLGSKLRVAGKFEDVDYEVEVEGGVRLGEVR